MRSEEEEEAVGSARREHTHTLSLSSLAYKLPKRERNNNIIDTHVCA